MKRSANAMANEFMHYFQIEFFGYFVNNGANRIEWRSWSTYFNSFVAAQFGHPHQILCLIVHIANGKCATTITMHTIRKYLQR